MGSKVTSLVLLIVFCSVFGTITANSCLFSTPEVPNAWITMQDSCTKAMKNQVQEELKASMTYLAMGAHFSLDYINRPGLANFFFEAASEEREHAIKIISYLLMRGELTSNLRDIIQSPLPHNSTWSSGLNALKNALDLEASVTRSIRNIIETCENDEKFNDYHLVDHLIGEFLEEQYRGQRHLAGLISTLDKMYGHHGALSEFLFDKKLLKGELLA